MRLALALLAEIVVLLALAGCVSWSPPRTQVQQVPDRAEPLPPGHARIVFVRPTSYGPTQPFFIVDESGRLLGEVPAESRLHLTVPAGQHTFIGWHHAVLGDYGEASLVTGELQAGRAYLVLIGSAETPMQLRSTPLAIPNCGLMDAVVAARRVGPDPSPDPKTFEPGKVNEQIAEAREEFADRRDKHHFFWTFHNRGGTYEAFFARGDGSLTLAQLFGKHGAGQLCDSMRGKAQSEVDLNAWEAYLDGLSSGVDFEWKKAD